MFLSPLPTYNMKKIKEITKNGYTLNHSWYLDDLGLQKNSFDLFHEETRTHYPFFGRIRVNNYDRNTPISGDDVSPYTDQEYEEMLDEQVLKVSHYNKL